jgi:serine/threonine protein kinase
MANLVTLTALDGSHVEFMDEIIGQGGMKDVYFSPDKSYVVCMFRTPADMATRDRLLTIADTYRERIFNQVGGDFWKERYCWPTKVVEYDGRLGIVTPTYQSDFFFKVGSRNNDFLSIKGKEKEGKWFASAFHQNKNLDPSEKGDWFSYVRICWNISRAVRRMHSAGLAHSDLSYKNVLIDPCTGKAAIIDIDGLVVPGRFPPDVIGTPDFIAPEVLATLGLDFHDKGRKFPCIPTDRHALAVMIYMYLLRRHPLRGRKVNDPDPQRDEELSMGPNALFIEHPTDKSNRPSPADLRPSYLPWGDVSKMPYSVCGPYLKKLFDRAFISGLHTPSERPTADDWETALMKTVDLLQPCSNAGCEQKWYVFDNTTVPKCPFCGTRHVGQLPMLNLYTKSPRGQYSFENHRLMVYNNQYLYRWHVSKNVSPNERVGVADRPPVGYFVFHQGKWKLINQNMVGLRDLDAGVDVAIGQAVELKEGQRLLLTNEDGGRLAIVQITNN